LIKNFIKKYFENFAYFYSYLGYRIFVLVIVSILIGLMDGLGLTMFLPLLQMVNDSSEVDPEALGSLRFVLDFFQNMGIPMSLMAVLVIMASFFFLKGIITYLGSIYNVNVRENFIRALRIRNIKGLNNLEYKYFVMSDVGRIQNTLSGEVDRVAAAYTNYFKAFQDGVLVIVYMGFAFTMDAQFAILVTVGGILTNFLYKSLYKNTKVVSRTLTGQNNNFQSLIIQNVGNYKYLKATGSLQRYGRKLEESVEKIKTSNTRIGELNSILISVREPILIFVVITVIYIQTSLLGSQLGPLLISLLFFYRALNILIQMQVKWNKFLSVSGSLENMTSFQRELRKHEEKKGKTEIKERIENIELSNISFYYNETLILKDISLEVKRNETVAFVGESGSGKTTLVNVIAGLLSPDSGKYCINGENSNNLNIGSLQEKIGYITQDPVIFNDTIFNNISFWSENNPANLKKFWKAVEQSAILDFVNELPEKENTILGNNGVNLSGGQRQRISIARELFKDIEILILDEATSALDSETEKAIQANIDLLKGQYTILIIAHRISTIKNADRIVVMKDGAVSKIANFSDLLETSNYFKKMVELQEI